MRALFDTLPLTLTVTSRSPVLSFSGNRIINCANGASREVYDLVARD